MVALSIAAALLIGLVEPPGDAPAVGEGAHDGSVPSPPPHTKPGPTRVLVTALSASDVPAALVTVVSDALVLEVRKLDDTVVVGAREIEAMFDLEAERQLTGCEGDSCLAEVANAMGSEVMIAGGIATLDGRSVFTVKRIAPAEARVVASATRQLEPLGGEEFLAVIDELVIELFPDKPLRAGETRGVPPSVARRLHPPPLPDTPFYVACAAAGVGALGTAAAGVVNAMGNAQLEGKLAAASTTSTPYAEIESAAAVTNTSLTVLVVFASGAALAGVTAAILLPLTDFEQEAP